MEKNSKIVVVPADFPLLPDDIMQQIEISYPSIRRYADKMAEAGCARKIGNKWFFAADAIAWLRQRPKVGRPKKAGKTLRS